MFDEIIKLSKKIATSLLNGKPSKSLTGSEIFDKADKEYILKNLTEERLVKERQDLRKQIDKKSDLKKINDVLGFPDSNWNWKYLAAAVITGVLATAYFFKDNINMTPNETNATVINKNIEAGTDKAVLTLEDGTSVLLGNDKVYQANHVISNGKKLVYKTKDNPEGEAKYNVLTVPRGGQFNILLSDGTEVWLNSESQLKYPVAFIKGAARDVELVYGEAYFDVSPSSNNKGSVFKVLSKDQEIQVLGTEFNVKAYRDEINTYTTLVEGMVAVHYNSEIQNLLPNQQSTLNATTKDFIINTVDVSTEILWKEGVFSFDNKPLKDIMKVLSRWYDFTVVFESYSIESEEFMGVLDKNQNIEDILNRIKDLGAINDYEINGRNVIIR